MKQLMDAHTITAWRSVTEEAIRTLTRLSQLTTGVSREGIMLRVDDLKATLQEALDSALPPVQAEPALDQSVPVMGEIGRVYCINVAAHQPPELRYYGAHKGATGQAHHDFEDAVADVRNWYAGKPVEYAKQAEVSLVPPGTSWGAAARKLEERGIARLAPAAAAGAHASSTIGSVLAQPGGDQLVAELQAKRNRTQAHIAAAFADSRFVIGPGNNYEEVRAAMIAGHQVRMPTWPAADSWIFDGERNAILLVQGNTKAEWKATGRPVYPADAAMLFPNWTVLPIVDHETPTV